MAKTKARLPTGSIAAWRQLESNIPRLKKELAQSGLNQQAQDALLRFYEDEILRTIIPYGETTAPHFAKPPSGMFTPPPPPGPPGMPPSSMAPVSGVMPREERIETYQQYVLEHPEDVKAREELERLLTPAIFEQMLDIEKLPAEIQVALSEDFPTQAITVGEFELWRKEQVGAIEAVEQAIEAVFPKAESPMEFIEWAFENEENTLMLAEEILKQGRNEQTIALLDFLGLDEAQIEEFFTTPGMPTEAHLPPEIMSGAYPIPEEGIPFAAQGVAGEQFEARLMPDGSVFYGDRELGKFDLTTGEYTDYTKQAIEQMPLAVRVHAAGWGNVSSSAAGIARRFGNPELASFFDKWATEFQGVKPQDISFETEYSDIRMLSEANFWYTVLESLPYMEAIMPAMLAGAYGGGVMAASIGASKLVTLILTSVAAGGTSAVAEGLMEGGMVYNEAIRQGMTEEEAAEAFDKTFLPNVALLSGTNALEFALAFSPIKMPIPGKLMGLGLKIFGGAVMEGSEEVFQDIFSRRALGQEVVWDKSMMQQFLAGAAIGGIFTSAGNMYQTLHNRVSPRLSEEARLKLDEDIRTGIEQGLGEVEATIQGLNNLAETPEGERIIKNEVRKMQREEQPPEVEAPPEAIVPAVEAGAPEVPTIPVGEKVPPMKKVTIPPEQKFNIKEIQKRQKEIGKLLATKGRLPEGEGTKGALKVEQARLEAQTSIQAMVKETKGDREALGRYVADAKAQVWQEIGNRSLPYHGAARAEFSGYTMSQLDEMAKVYGDFMEALKLGEVIAPVPVVQQVEQLRSEIADEVKAMQVSIEGLKGAEAQAVREALGGLQRELKTAEAILKGFRQRPDMPDATKLRSTIMAWATHKGFTKSQLKSIISKTMGRSTLTPLMQEELVSVLDAVMKARPARIKGKVVVTQKTEHKIQSLRDSLARLGMMDDAHYQRIMGELGLRADRYTNAYNYITESDAKGLIRTMNEQAWWVMRQKRAERGINQKGNENLKAFRDGLRKRSAQHRQRLEKKGKVGKTPSELFDMALFTSDMSDNTGQDFFKAWEWVNASHLDARAATDFMNNRLLDMPQAKEIIADEVRRNRVRDYIASKYKESGIAYPKDITPQEIAIAQRMESDFASFEADTRLGKFELAYRIHPNDPKRMKEDFIPDAPVKDLREAIDTFEGQGQNALEEYLLTKEWGVIEQGYEPLSVAYPNFLGTSSRLETLSARHLKPRQGIQYPAQDRSIFQRYYSYIKQMHSRRYMKPALHHFERLWFNNFDHFDKPHHIKGIFETNINEMKGYRQEYDSWIARAIRRLYSQTMSAVFFDPYKWFRNKWQNLAFSALRFKYLRKATFRKMEGHLKVWYGGRIDMMRGLTHDYMMQGYDPLPGAKRIVDLANKNSKYPWTDRTNRQESTLMYYDNAQKALARYNKHHNVDRLFKETYALEFTRAQQEYLVELLAQPVVSFQLEGMPNVTGQEAFALEVAREGTNLTHFRYEKAQGAPAQQGSIGGILGNLFTFPRSWGQRVVRQGMKLAPNSGATFAERLVATKVVGGMLVMAFLVGEIFRRITGRRFNPYDPLNILSWTPGGLVLGATAEIGSLIYNAGQAVFGDKTAQGRFLSALPRVASLTLPFYDIFFNSVESATQTKNLDYYFLKKVRELLDSEYKMRGGRHNIERDWVSLIQHALFRGEVPEYEMPDNPELIRLKDEFEELFDLYYSYGDAMSPDYIEDEGERREARELLLRENKDFADARRAVDFYELGYWDDKAMEAFKETAWWKKYIHDIPLIGEMYGKPNALKIETGLLNDYLEYGRTIDKFGANSSEALLFRHDHPDLQSFGSLTDEEGKAQTFGWQELDLTEQEVQRHRLIVKNRELIEHRDGLGVKGSEYYVADEDARAEARDKLRFDNPEFHDDERRLTALENGVPSDAIMESYVEYMKVGDEFGSNSPQAHKFLLEHPALHAWGSDEDVFGWQSMEDWNEDLIDLQVTWHNDLEKHAGYGVVGNDWYIVEEGDRADAREAMLRQADGSLTDFGKVYFKIDGLKDGYSKEVIDKHVEFNGLPKWGSWRERYLLANPDFAMQYYNPTIGEGHAIINPADVKPQARDEIYGEYREQFLDWDKTGGMTEDQVKKMRAKLLAVEGFAEARYRVQAYDEGIDEKHHDSYVEWYLDIEGKSDAERDTFEGMWYEDEWWLMEHKDFYNMMYEQGIWTEKIDFSKVPTKEIWATFKVYKSYGQYSGNRLAMRCSNAELDGWLVAKFDLKPAYGMERCTGVPAPSEYSEQEIKAKVLELMTK